MESKKKGKGAGNKARERDKTQVGDLPEKPLTRDEETNVRGGDAQLANVDLQNTL